MVITYPNKIFSPNSLYIKTTEEEFCSKKKKETQYQIQSKIMQGSVENMEIDRGILLTVSDFVLKEDIEMITTHSDLILFQVSFCLDGGMEWAYINGDLVHQFRIGAQQSQVRYGTIQECRSILWGGSHCRSVSITLDEKMFAEIFACIKARGALCNTNTEDVARVYTYTPNVSKILSEIIECSLCDELKKIYLRGKVLELIAIYCDEVICKSPTNDYGIQISSQGYAALLNAREIINQNFTHPLTISTLAKESAINEQQLKEGFRRCFGCTIKEYIVEKRMEMAKTLLTTGKYSVKDAAWMVGYSHTGYFISLFRKHYGLSPGELLQNNK
ncbi:MAG: helix-turn-helix transcriptional regulator [Lachnospiraceae bacterium]